MRKIIHILFNTNLLQIISILLAVILFILIFIIQGLHAIYYVVFLSVVIVLACNILKLYLLNNQLYLLTRDLTDTKKHFEKRIQQGTNEKEKIILELKKEMDERRKVEASLAKLRKEEDGRQRKKLAVELHDRIGHGLQSIKLLLKTHLVKHEDNKLPMQESQDIIFNEIDTAIKQVRQMTDELRPIFLDSMNILDAIHAHNEKINEYANIEILINHDKDQYILSDLIKEYIFLIYREIINNIIKHAEASLVITNISQENKNWFCIEIKDNGKGFNPASIQEKGHGLSLINERINDIGGRLDIKSSPNKGTSIYIKVPSCK